MTNPNTDVIHTGDSMDVLDDLPENSVHAVVTDPPYGLAFMGRDWDDFEPKEYQEWCEKWARKAKRVLKPGGHMLAFSGNRTHHRLFTGVEDAGFEIRDTVTWHYGSGFPKALDVSKAIDKQADAEREVVGEYVAPDGNKRWGGRLEGEYESEDYGEYDGDATEQTAPATDAAREWDGFKTALKPATEYVVVVRKPLSEGTVAENVQTHGTGALNIDGTRIHTDEELSYGGHEEFDPDRQPRSTNSDTVNRRDEKHEQGRYPSNVVFDEQAAEALDGEVGELAAGARTPQKTAYEGDIYGSGRSKTESERIQLEGGGPSRYFYTSKATRAERTLDGKIDNAHPTVKPSDLMEWLVRLVTAEGQTVLDPFAGSGTTCRAAKDLGREFIGIEKQAEWADVARVRCGLTPYDPSVVRGDDAQTGMEAFTSAE